MNLKNRLFEHFISEIQNIFEMSIWGTTTAGFNDTPLKTKNNFPA